MRGRPGDGGPSLLTNQVKVTELIRAKLINFIPFGHKSYFRVEVIRPSSRTALRRQRDHQRGWPRARRISSAEQEL